jgi:uncharacterized repeat protein (TIGR03943 family)
MKMVWSHNRVAIGFALAVWASLFWFMIAADRTSLYFASRTTWLAPVGAVTLTTAMIGRFLSARVHTPEPITKGHLRSILILVLPAVVIMASPPATLGSFAVTRRASPAKAAYASSSGVDLSKGDLSLLDIFGLSYSGELDKLARRAGSSSSFTGFVTRDSTDGAGEFRLNRFLISCCPGDAVSVQVRVVSAPPGTIQTDDWVRVTGKLYPVGKEVIVDATEVVRVDRPKHPYLD